jgi:hypothetical protein
MSTSPLGSKSFPQLGTQPRRALELPLRFVGFWTAILVPFVLLGLIASGTALQSPGLFAGLLGANLAGLVVGRNYKR